MANSNLKFIGIILIVIGFFFIYANFVSPHTVLVETSVQVPNQVNVPNERSLGSASSFTLESNYYHYFYGVPITAGQTFKMNWSSDTSLTAYIFTQNQFSNYQSQQLGFNINYQATGLGKTGTLTYDVQDSDNYVAVIKNGGSLFGGSSAQVYQFTISSISYTSQTQYTTQKQMVQQNDNLNLYIGFIFMILGILMFLFFQKAIPSKNTQSAENLPNSGIPIAAFMHESKTVFEQPQQETMPKSEKKTPNNSVNYMLFVLGAILIIVGIYLSTYTTVVMVNHSMSIYGYSIDVPQPEQVQPYQSIGIIVIVFALVLIAIAFYKITSEHTHVFKA